MAGDVCAQNINLSGAMLQKCLFQWLSEQYRIMTMQGHLFTAIHLDLGLYGIANRGSPERQVRQVSPLNL